MLAVLRQRNYRLLWISQFVSMIGSWAMFAALPFFVFQLTGSVLATGIMFIVEVLPPVLIGTVAGVFVDRWDRKWTMIGANLVRAALFLLLIGFHSVEQVWLVYVVAFTVAIAGQFFGPANNALLPHLVSKKDLITANSLDALGENFARIIGPAIGGAMLAALGLSSVVIFNVSAYLIAALLIFQIKLDKQPEEKDAGADQSSRAEWLAFWKEWLAGLKLVFGQPTLSYVFLAIGIALIGDSILSVLLVVFVQDVVGVGATEFGWILTARGLGGVLGGLIVAQLGSRVRSRDLMTFGLIGSGIVLFLMVQTPDLRFVLAAALAVGLPVMAWLIAGQTWLQKNAPDEFRGRVFGAFETTSALMGLAGMAFATLFGESFGVVPSMNIAALLYALAGVAIFFLMRTEKT